MDNAGNNDVLARYLPTLIPSFRGMAARGRCFPHIINLLAKVCVTEIYTILDSTSIQIFISFFFRQPKKKVKDSEAANGMLKSDV
jgi:hypothetical protein